MSTIGSKILSPASMGIAVAWLAASLFACNAGHSATNRIAAPVPATTPLHEKSTDQHREIETLIEQLAISNEPAGDEPIYTPSIDTPETDKRVIAYKAADRLKQYGKAAFPQLLAHFNDNRQSVAFREVMRLDVGDACFCIIRDQLFDVPGDYWGSRQKPSDVPNARPQVHWEELFNESNAADWLEHRRENTLTHIQIEVVQWLIEMERQIGFRNETEREHYLYPLERELAKLNAQAESK